MIRNQGGRLNHLCLLYCKSVYMHRIFDNFLLANMKNQDEKFLSII